MERDVSDRIRSSSCDFGGDSVASLVSPESQARSPNLGGPISTADVVWFCGVGSRLLGTSVVRSTEARCNSIDLGNSWFSKYVPGGIAIWCSKTRLSLR